MRTRPAFCIVLGCCVLLAVSAAASESSVNINSRDELKNCADIQVSYDGHQATRAEQQMTLAGTSLVARGSHNGGLYLDSWDKADFAITACKAAKDASTLAAINTGLSGNELTTSGPEGSDWMVFYLVHAPRGASVDMSAHNGSVRLFHASGNFKIAAQNGPVSLEDCSGTIEADAQNGPVRVKGGQGNFTLNARNGPVSVSLLGTSWQGRLEVNTHNGPTRLTIPNGFQSAVLVESDGHSPMRCRVAGCDQAQNTGDRERRVLRLGAGEPVIKLTTHNGPVDVRGDHELM